ncbi:hypothetical protein [Amycolatopsis sp. lyj-23]|uniref:hypothetical protein n=1 Tax=Amycolatopsis sp. lyj-23 TaxID=2789283 RepID=UPI00397DBB5D
MIAVSSTTWGLPFTDTGETLPNHLGRFARRVVPLIVRRGDQAHRLVAHPTTQTDRGEFVDNIAAFASTTALADNAFYGPCSCRRLIWTRSGSSNCGCLSTAAAPIPTRAPGWPH